MNLTSLLRPYFMKRVAVSESWIDNTEATQRNELGMLLRHGMQCAWGREHNFRDIKTYEDFRERVEISPYETIRPYVMRMIGGERDVLWPGRVKHFAQSSGTSDGKSKYIPITSMSFSRSHFRGSSDVVAHYLHCRPDSRLFSGKAFILGGSFANELGTYAKGIRVGDLSANLIDSINPLAEIVRVPSKKVALMENWTEKLPALVESAKRQNITNISGVPSWFLTVLRETIKACGANTIHDVWPNLEVFFHGGISFKPYREQYLNIVDRAKMHFQETYNASEGFFALQNDLSDPSMLLLLDAGTFYEFKPIDNPASKPLAAWELEQGNIYELIITGCNGLWRYPIGDTVKVESTRPLKITIAGRTKHYINVFGEEVMVHNTDAAIAKASSITGCEIANYTVGPIYSTPNSRGRHQWLIEFNVRPNDMALFETTLDECLCNENSDYQAKRSGDIFLAPLTIDTARKGLFDDWLATTGKLGGQRKVPRLCNDRHIIDSMLKLNN